MEELLPYEKAVLARARLLTDFRWTPVRDVPTYLKNVGQTVLPAGVEVLGFPYSSTERQDKFITENVSIETFLTAIPNPYSKLYQPGHGAFYTCNYGVVCNGFVRYALDIKRRVPTEKWFAIPGMRKIAAEGAYKAEDICLCDILHAYGKGRNHVALVTDLIRDDAGRIVKIEVSEAVRPSCKRASYTTEEFFEKYKLFSLCRYDKLPEVTFPDMQDEKLLWEGDLHKRTPGIAVDNGNKSNYLLGEEVILSVFAEGENTVLLYKNGELSEKYSVVGNAVIALKPEKGYYTASLENTDDAVEFSVNCAKVSYEVKDGMLTFHADPQDSDSEILYMDFRKKEKEKGACWGSLAKYEELTDEEKNTGTICRLIPPEGENFKVYYKNKYGVWTHPMKPLK